MKTSVGILLTGALLVAPIPLSFEAVGEEQKAAAGQESEWEFNGDVEVGGRAFIKRPPSGYGFGSTGVPLTAKQTDSRAKFEEYGEIKPGLFLDHAYLGLAKKDGTYTTDLWITNPGFNNQNYLLQMSRPGNSSFFMRG